MQLLHAKQKVFREDDERNGNASWLDLATTHCNMHWTRTPHSKTTNLSFKKEKPENDLRLRLLGSCCWTFNWICEMPTLVLAVAKTVSPFLPCGWVCWEISLPIQSLCRWHPHAFCIYWILKKMYSVTNVTQSSCAGEHMFHKHGGDWFSLDTPLPAFSLESARDPSEWCCK